MEWIQLLIGELPGVGYSWPLIFLYGGKIVAAEERLVRFVSGSFLQARPLGVLKGGKGGFGTLLRGQAAFRKKSQNVSACRDLEGRRLRDVEAEKRLTKWYAEREQDKSQMGNSYSQQARRNEESEQTKRQHEEIKAQVGNTCRTVEANTESAVVKGLAMATKRKRNFTESSNEQRGEKNVADQSKRRWILPTFEDSSDEDDNIESSTCVQGSQENSVELDNLLSSSLPIANISG
ncbi:Protein SDE2 [Galdieria sulphuraria]|nr:Protein SDE2 [Galdieria sulphuraria]